MLFMSVYEWLLTKNQRKAYSFMKFLKVSELKNKAGRIITEIEISRDPKETVT